MSSGTACSSSGWLAVIPLIKPIALFLGRLDRLSSLAILML